jgi:membrane-bound lytic murein transglycosylase B
VREGRKLYGVHRALLDKISARYGVPASVIVALWGVETSYGKVTGGFNVPHALATLAYEGRRAEFFRKELLNALTIIERGHISAANMKGSWAGAMGQSQFMPSSFLSFAEDYNGDGKRDIWTTQADVFASIANYLHKSGWNGKARILDRVSIPAAIAGHENIDRFRPMKEWETLGVKLRDGAALPAAEGEAALVFPGKPEEGAWLVYRNYHVLLKWNRSRYFATAVGTLAGSIGGGR